MDVVAVPDNAWQEYGAQGRGMHVDFVLAGLARSCESYRAMIESCG
jgi:hypothetical protein